MVEGLVEHLERHLGEIAGTWDAEPDGTPLPFQIVHYELGGGDAGRSPRGVEIFSTFGMSDYELGAHAVRVELLMIAPRGLTPGTVPPILHHVGSMPLEADDVPELGDIFSAVYGLSEVSPMRSLYVGRPLYQPSSFSPFDNGFEMVHFLWLIPVYDVEAEFVNAEGWPAFEQLMWDLDVDPTDFTREPWLD